VGLHADSGRLKEPGASRRPLDDCAHPARGRHSAGSAAPHEISDTFGLSNQTEGNCGVPVGIDIVTGYWIEDGRLSSPKLVAAPSLMGFAAAVPPAFPEPDMGLLGTTLSRFSLVWQPLLVTRRSC
jgi:hypothetical protein